MEEISKNNLRKSKSQVRAVLDLYERNKILEVYFSRAEGFFPKVISSDLEAIYQLDLEEIKDYLMNQQPVDPILHRIFNLIH